MDYEKKYKKALERAKDMLQYREVRREDVEYLFPELKESEDDKMKKIISDILLIDSDEIREILNSNNVLMQDIDAWLEKQSEQKPADKVEPKFKIGDLITNGTIIGEIDEINEHGYHAYFGDHYADVPDIEKWHLWTIEDAKNGDVLFHSDTASNGIFIFKEILQCETIQEVVCYCDYDSEDGFCLGEKHTCCWTHSKILHPATKEQRDTLLKAMADAGYTFDFEKKELKKIDNEEWSKEDYNEIDLEKELESWRHNHFHGRRDKEASGEYLERVSQLNLAKHFFELGIKVQKGEEV